MGEVAVQERALLLCDAQLSQVASLLQRRQLRNLIHKQDHGGIVNAPTAATLQERSSFEFDLPSSAVPSLESLS